MAAENVCSWYKFGYRRHKEFCRRQHVKNICDKSECDVSNCSSRHPRFCKYCRDYGKCKFNPCMFLHVEKENDSQIEELIKENESIAKKLVDVENALSEIDIRLQQSEVIIEKLEDIEKKFERVIEVEKEICERDCEISTITSKVAAIEIALKEKDNIIDNLVILWLSLSYNICLTLFQPFNFIIY